VHASASANLGYFFNLKLDEFNAFCNLAQRVTAREINDVNSIQLSGSGIRSGFILDNFSRQSHGDFNNFHIAALDCIKTHYRVPLCWLVRH
jgi:hypothetical protein